MRALKKTTIFSSALFFTLSTTALFLGSFAYADSGYLSDEDFSDSITTNPAIGIYFGAMAGISNPDLPSGTQTRTVGSETYNFTTNNERFSGNVHMGNLWGINNLFSMGVELGATYWGSYDFNGTGSTTGSIGYNTETFNILIDFQWNITPSFFIMPQGGVAFDLGSASGNLTSGANSISGDTKHKASPLVGINIGFNVTPQFSVYLSAERLMGDQFNNSYVGFSQRLLQSNAYYLGINYNIGQ